MYALTHKTMAIALYTLLDTFALWFLSFIFDSQLALRSLGKLFTTKFVSGGNEEKKIDITSENNV